jgi:hypothetical protein
VRKNILLLLAPLGIVFLAAQASGQTNDNLLVNPGFATDLSGWTYTPVFTQWSSHDVNSAASSGSANILETDDVGDAQVVQQCVVLPGPGPYDVGVSFYLPSGEGQRPGGAALIDWYASSDCSGSSMRFDEFDTPNPPPTDVWTSVLGSSVDPPAGSASAMLYFGIFKNDDATGPDVVGYVDGTSFGPTSLSLGVTTVNLPDARVGENYRGAVESSGGLLPYVWDLAAGSSMPPGLFLGADGSVTGIPLDAGSFTFGVMVRDGASHQVSASVGISVLPPLVRMIKTPNEPMPVKVTERP